MFGKRLNILSIAGIKIGIDISWFFIAFLLSWSLAAAYFPFYYHGLSAATYWLMGIFGMLGLFVCIVLHELSHAMVAKAYGIPISNITLFIFGGVAEIKREPNLPSVEFLMAIAGPIMSLILALIAFLLNQGGIQWDWPIVVTGILGYLAFINTVLAIFNLLPAFPLDGGRVFHAILWWWKGDLTWATQVSTALGTGLSFTLIMLGIFVLFLISFLSGFWLIILVNHYWLVFISCNACNVFSIFAQKRA
jgi:Zn-dependent protease